MSAKLLVDGVGNWAFTFELNANKVTRIGRTKENELSLPEGSVSTRHAEIYCDGEDWHIRDVGSHNGTYLNKVKVTDAAIKDGDILKIGKCDLVFHNTAKKRKIAEDTLSMISSHEGQLRQFVEESAHGQAIALPNLIANQGGAGDAVPIAGGGGFSADDNMWIATKMVEALAELAKPHEDKYELFRAIVGSLKRSVAADNGFVMMVDPKVNRWVIRAWVGDYMQWNSYEQEHPLPLTIAKKAFSDKRVLTNAVAKGEVESASASFKKLNVAGYIAVPLVEGSASKGLLYFDTRESQRMFTPREVELVSRLGGYVLEIERREG